MNIEKRTLWILIMVCITVSLLAQTSSSADNDTTRSDCPSYVRFVESEISGIIEVQLSDEEFYRTAGSVIFPVNKYALRKDDPMVQELENVVIPRANSEKWKLVGVDMRSSASPEGPYWWNVELGKRRGQAIMDFLKSRLTLPPLENSVATKNKVEDYDYLCYLMHEAGDADERRVRHLMRRSNGDLDWLKRNLQELDGGDLWKRLYRTYFPKIRAARIVLYFMPSAVQRIADKVVEEKPTDALIPTVEIPEAAPTAKFETFESVAMIDRQCALAIKSNLLYDAFYMPNYGWAPSPDVELEFFPRKGKFSYIAALTFPYWQRWSKNKFFEIRDYRLEVRRYFPSKIQSQGQRQSQGPFLGVSVNNNIYGIGFNKKKGWQGEGFGASVTGGFVHRLGKDSRWRMEYVVGLGYYETRFDPYIFGNPITGVEDGDYYYDYTGLIKDFNRRNHRRRWLGPTQLGIKLSYDLLFYRVQRHGVGLKRKEMVR